MSRNEKKSKPATVTGPSPPIQQAPLEPPKYSPPPPIPQAPFEPEKYYNGSRDVAENALYIRNLKENDTFYWAVTDAEDLFDFNGAIIIAATAKETNCTTKNKLPLTSIYKGICPIYPKAIVHYCTIIFDSQRQVIEEQATGCMMIR
ncbi:hypothetical protein D918_00223 [Trichuris suis]|nr:hypothetical protein D918_00223 [Trichuris suis]